MSVMAWSLCTITLLAVIIAVPLGIYYLLDWIRGKNDPSLCSTEACDRYASLFRSTINRSVKPCDNFYHYVCDGWVKERGVPARLDAYRNFLITMEEQASLLASSPVGRQGAVDKAAAFYQSCLAVTDENNDNVPKIKLILEKANLSWPYLSKYPNVIHSMVYLSTQWSWPSALDFRTRRDDGSIAVLPSKSFGSVMFRGFREDLKDDSTYQDYFDTILRHYTKDGYISTQPLNFTGLVELENMFTGIGVSYNDRKSQRMVKQGTAEEVFPKEWLGRMNQSLERFLNSTMRASRIVIYNPAFMETVFDLMSQHGESSMELFLGWNVVQFVSLYANRQLVYNVFGSKERAVGEHDLACFDLVTRLMSAPTIAAFVDTCFSRNIRTEVSEIARNVRETVFDTALITHDWRNLDTMWYFFNGSRDANLESEYSKYPVMGSNVIDNFPATLAAYKKSAMYGVSDGVVEAFNTASFYVFLENEYSLMPYAINFPLYQEGVPMGIRYGGLGSEIAMATMVSYIRMHGENVPPVVTTFHECVHKKSTRQANFGATLSSMSVDAIWKASQKESDFGKRRLAKLTEYTDKELLFITFCFMRCLRQNEDEICNMPLRFNRHFSDTFSCKEPSRMMEPQQCQAF